MWRASLRLFLQEMGPWGRWCKVMRQEERGVKVLSPYDLQVFKLHFCLQMFFIISSLILDSETIACITLITIHFKKWGTGPEGRDWRERERWHLLGTEAIPLEPWNSQGLIRRFMGTVVHHTMLITQNPSSPSPIIRLANDSLASCLGRLLSCLCIKKW